VIDPTHPAIDRAFAPASETLLARHDDGEIHHADWRALAECVRALGGCDALIVDAPYSARTHAGHDGAAAAEEGATWVRSNGRVESKIRRRDIDYSAWSQADVASFVETWAPLVRGWIVSITDSELASAWRSEMERAGRLGFQPLACVETGATVRLAGDGPSSWTTWACVSRPRSKSMARWGTLPGAYVGAAERKPVVGGKPLWLMRALVRDYTRPGDLVVDPCGGGGTTALAARLEGRRFVTGDADRAHAEIMRERLAALPEQPARDGTLALFGGDR